MPAGPGSNRSESRSASASATRAAGALRPNATSTWKPRLPSRKPNQYTSSFFPSSAHAAAFVLQVLALEREVLGTVGKLRLAVALLERHERILWADPIQRAGRHVGALAVGGPHVAERSGREDLDRVREMRGE